MANLINISKVIALLRRESADLVFDMGTYVSKDNDDKYEACVAGYAYLAATGEPPEIAAERPARHIDEKAAEFLGLDHVQAINLFYDLPDEIALTDVTVDQAVTTLERLARTGEVVWSTAH